MAGSGSFSSNIYYGAANNRWLVFNWWIISQDIINNQTTIGWEVVGGGTGGYHVSGPIRATIEGEQVLNYTGRINLYSGTVVGSGTKVIAHNNDGIKNFTASAEGAIYVTSINVWGSGSWDLTVIPRYPTVTNSIATANIRTRQVSVNWSSSATADAVQYSLNGGAWTATSGNPYVVVNLTPNTAYTIRTRARRQDNGLWGETSTLSFTTLREPYISAPANINFTLQPAQLASGNNLELTIYNPDNFRIVADLKTGNVIRATREIASGTAINVRLTQSEIDAIYAASPNSSTIAFSIDIKGFTGTTQIGTTQNKTGTITFPSNIDTNPTFTDFDFEDTNTDTIALTGNNQIIINGYSDIQTTVSVANKAIAKKSASMVSYRTMIGSKDNSGNFSDVAPVFMNIPAVDSSAIVVAAIDSRGFQTTATKVATFKNYSIPVIANFVATRQDGAGQTIYFEVNGTFWNEDFGAITNTIIGFEYRYRKGTEEWQPWSSIMTGITVNPNGTFKNNTNGSNYFPDTFDNVAYTIQVRAIDRISSISASSAVNSGIPNEATRKNPNGYYSTGKNKFPRAGDNIAYDILGDVLIEGNLFADNIGKGIHRVGDIIMSASPTNPSAKYGGTWAVWSAGRVPMGMGSNGTTNYTTVEATGGADSVALSVANLAAHGHSFTGGYTDVQGWHAHMLAGVAGGAEYIPPYSAISGNYTDTGPNAAYRYAPNTLGSGNHSHNVYGTVANNGSGTAHENRTSFQTCYIWKKTAD